ncbi:hypothetical protein ABH922_000283 [Rhodococcus sp. 27YEA15]|uniref:DUF4132 domain-containing protein n=1 Tax=Rhodococcus sp. 27YEA15 TaxID=3156259 RepID=UPI003C7D1582
MSAEKSTWMVPVSWWRRGEAVHGRTPTPKSKGRASKVNVVDDLITRSAARLQQTLEHPDSPTPWADEARAFVAGRRTGDSVTALGGAVVWTITTAFQGYPMRVPFVDYVIAEFGELFAAEMMVLAAGMRLRYRNVRQAGVDVDYAVTDRLDRDVSNFGVVDAHSRVRSALAALSDSEYAAAVATLGRYRGSLYTRDIAVSFLLPTEKRWVTEDLERASRLDADNRYVGLALLSCIDSLVDAERVLALSKSREHAIWEAGIRMNFVYAMCANVGPGVERLIGEFFDGNLSAQNKKRCAAILAEFDTDAGFVELAARIGRKYVDPAIIGAIEHAPERARRLLPSVGPKAAAFVRDLHRLHPEFAGGAAVEEVPQAANEDVPALLVNPPWAMRRERAEVPVLDVGVRRRPLFTAWRPGEREAWSGVDQPHDRYLGSRTWPSVVDGIIGGDDTYSIHEISFAPDEVLTSVVATAAVPRYLYGAEADLCRILGRLDAEAADYVLRTVKSSPIHTARALLPIGGSEVAAWMLARIDSKSIRPVAVEWFDRHIESAAHDIVVAAVGDRGPERTSAQKTLHALARRSHRESLIAAAREHGSAVESSVVTIVDADPLVQLPKKIPTLPEWLDPALLPTIALRDSGTVLPRSAVQHVCTMFALSRMDEVYAGIDVIRTLIEPGDLAVFAWQIFERWSNAGFPDAQRWSLDALGIVGDDDTARRLTPFVRRWPLESAHRRASNGLAVLAMIGTDAALGCLWSISQGLRFPALRAKADANIGKIADELDLSPLDLADRLIPDLGLDDDGTTTFDYGDRSFVLSLDSTLRIAVREGQEKARARLPRPGPEDPEVAHEEYKRYKILRRDLESARGELIGRFEQAMVSQRRWTFARVQRYLVGHPLAWYLTGRLVWATEGGRYFRFSDLRSPVGSRAEDFALGDADIVTIAHPVTMGAELQTWRDVFDDIGLEQPFAQLNREVFDVADVASKMSALEGFKASTDQLLALGRRGWEREEAQDKGAQIALEKHIGDGKAVIMVFPGFNAARAAMWAEQKIVHVFHTGAALSPIDASELARDLSTVDVEQIRGDEADLQGIS